MSFGDLNGLACHQLEHFGGKFQVEPQHHEFILNIDFQMIWIILSWKCDVIQKEERFSRFNIIEDKIVLKIELINDVPARVGKTQKHPILGRIYNAENILANKITDLLDRNEPKDLTDIWGFCCVKGLSIQDAIANAQEKAGKLFFYEFSPEEPQYAPHYPSLRTVL